MKNLKFYAILVITCLLVYFPILGHDFQLNWDDNWQVMNHYTEAGFTWHNLQAVFSEFYYGQFSPINEAVYMAIYAVFGYNPAIYHLYSLLLHIANTCMVFIFINILAKILSNQMQHRTSTLVAFLTSLLFAIHPLQVESVAWISASKIPLYTFFTLLALLAYIRYVRTQSIFLIFGIFVLFVCAFGSKEQSIVLPATLLLLDWALGRHRKPDGTGNWLYLLSEKLPFIAFAVFAGLYSLSQQNAAWIDQAAGYPFRQRLVFACYSLVVYAGRLVAPAHLLYLYPFPISPGDVLPARYFIYPVIVATAVYLLCIRLKSIPRPVIFGLLFFLINMALMLHFIPMSRVMVTADRYVYLASIGVFFVAAWYALPWLQEMFASSKKWILAIAICYLFYLGGYAHVRTYVWSDSDTLKAGFWEQIFVD